MQFEVYRLSDRTVVYLTEEECSVVTPASLAAKLKLSGLPDQWISKVLEDLEDSCADRTIRVPVGA